MRVGQHQGDAVHRGLYFATWGGFSGGDEEDQEFGLLVRKVGASAARPDLPSRSETRRRLGAPSATRLRLPIEAGLFAPSGAPYRVRRKWRAQE
jgi:hypothetical protein